MKTLYKFRTLVFIAIAFLAFSEAGAVKWNVQVSNFAFTPSNLPNVNVGDTIRWQWVSGVHTTTSSSIPAGAATWDNLISSTAQVYEYKVTVSGTYNYVCTPHLPGMIATFVASGVLPTLNISPSNQNVNAGMGVTNFSVTSNSNWSANSNAAWCTVTPSGTGNGTITANVEENTTYSVRVANITVNVSGLPASVVTVTQDASTVSVKEIKSSDLNVYPNPSSGSFKIVLESGLLITEYEILDLTGKSLQRMQIEAIGQFEIDLSTRPEGFYLLKVSTEKGQVIKRLVVSR
jgi:plastocyanin